MSFSGLLAGGLLLLTSFECFAEEHILLEASSGSYQVTDLGDSSSQNKFRAKFGIVKYADSSQWPPAAYAGFYEGENRDNSVQLVLIRNKPNDNHLVVGYRLIKDGKEIKVGSIQNVKLESTVEVTLAFDSGTARIHVDEEKEIIVDTNMKSVRGYLSVSSGVAEYRVDVDI